jgi:hypothetical protein
MKQWKVQVIEDGDDFIIEFPDEVLEGLGVGPGDTLVWESHKDYVTIRKETDENSSSQ